MTSGCSRVRYFASALAACALFYAPGLRQAQSVPPTPAKAPDPIAELRVQNVRTGLNVDHGCRRQHRGLVRRGRRRARGYGSGDSLCGRGRRRLAHLHGTSQVRHQHERSRGPRGWQ